MCFMLKILLIFISCWIFVPSRGVHPRSHLRRKVQLVLNCWYQIKNNPAESGFGIIFFSRDSCINLKIELNWMTIKCPRAVLHFFPNMVYPVLSLAFTASAIKKIKIVLWNLCFLFKPCLHLCFTIKRYGCLWFLHSCPFL